MSQLTQITIERLLAVGFIDPAGNGMAYRKNLPGDIFEIVWYCKVDSFLRLQTIWSGGTTPLKGCTSMEQLNLTWYLLTGEELTTE